QAYTQAKIRHGSDSRSKEPFQDKAYGESFANIHNRPINNRRRTRMSNYKCKPGAVRLFCNIYGKYYTCERVETTDMLFLGDVWTGFKPFEAERQQELFRHTADCGNCIVQRTCNTCFTVVSQRFDTDDAAVDGEFFNFKCDLQRKSTAQMFAEYTQIMESNPHAFDPVSKSAGLAIFDTGPSNLGRSWYDRTDGSVVIDEECLVD
ncbi:MAG: hypothetical protein ACJ8LM_17085, partial [Candidatus Udaeobacter sp.]